MATSGDLQLALLIKANAEQAKAELASVQAQLKDVEVTAAATGGNAATSVAQLTDASTQAASAAAGTADAAASASQALNAWGETAEQQTARLKAVAQAAVAEREAAAASAGAARDAAAQTTAATAEEAAAYQALVERQNASMQAGTRAFLAREAGLEILQKSKLTTADVAKAEQLLGEAVAGGAISQKLMDDALSKVDMSKVKDVAAQESATAATKANTKANIENAASQKVAGDALNYRSRRELGTMVSELASGNVGRVRTSFLALLNAQGLFTKLLTPMGLGIAGVVAALGTLAVAFAKGENETSAFNKALILTGGYAGQTVGQLQVLAQETAKITDSTQHAAAAAVAAVVQSGKFYGDTVGLVAQAAVAMQQTTGQAVDRTIAEFTKLGDEPVKASVELNNATHYLTQAVYDQITALVERGEKDEAARVAQDAYAQAQIKRANDVQQNLGALEIVLHSVAGAAKGMWDALLDIGRIETPESKVDKLRKALADQQALLANAGKVSTGGSGLAGGADLGGLNATISADVIKANIARIQQQIKDALTADMFASTDTRTAAMKQRLTDQAIAAQNALTSGAGTSAQGRLQARLNELAVQKAQALYGVVDPDKRQQIIDAFNLQVADAARQYDAAEKKLSPKSRKGPDLDAIAGRSAADAIKSQLQTLSNAYQNEQQTLDAQHKAGIVSDQQYFAQRLKDLTDFTNQRIALLQKERAAIEASATTPAAKARAAAQLAAIDEQITQAQQTEVAKRAQIEADEKKAIDDAHKAWVQLEQALGVPVTVNTDQAVEKLQQLQALIDKLKGSSQEPSAAAQLAAIEGTLQIGTQDQGNYRSLRNIPGAANRSNPLAQANQDISDENSLFNSNETQIGQNYAAEMTAAQGNAQRMMQIQQAYDAASEKEQTRHTQAMNQLSEARYYGELDTASDVFGQLATLASSQNKKVAAIGKAGAIAKAMIDTYKAAQSAYAAGMETGGPAAPYIAAAYAAIAVAAGLANVAQIRSQGTGGGYAKGGYTGDAPITQAVGFVHGREGVLSAPEVDAIGGEAGFNALRSAIRRGYADGGYVSPFANAPSPADLGFNAPSMPRVQLPSPAAMQFAPPAVNVKAVLAMNPDEIAHHVMNTPTGQKAIVVTVGNNPRAIQGKWSAG